MLTDDEARRLLRHAGDTVDVGPAAPIADVRRRALPVVAAAAAVVLLALATAIALGTHGSDRADPAPQPVPSADIQVPSVLGFAKQEAVRTMTDAGLIAQVVPTPSCTAEGTTLGTRPAPGTRVPPGSHVTVQVSGGEPAAYCVTEDQLAYDLLALADGRGDGPPLADDVTAYDRDGPAEVDAILAGLSAEAHAFRPAGGDAYLSSRLTATFMAGPSTPAGPPRGCRYAVGPEGAWPDREFVRIGVTASVGQDEEPPCPATVLDVYRSHGEVDLMAVRSLDEDVAPESGADTTVAEAFRDFALGRGPLPPMGSEVDLYLGNAFTGFVTEQTADHAAAWATCTETGSYAARSCPISPLDVLLQHRAVEYVDAPDGLCMPTYGPLPPDLRALERTVIVPAKGSVSSCIQNFAVQVLSDQQGELVAVSVLLGEP
jgi:hypothetical protein